MHLGVCTHLLEATDLDVILKVKTFSTCMYLRPRINAPNIFVLKKENIWKLHIRLLRTFFCIFTPVPKVLLAMSNISSNSFSASHSRKLVCFVANFFKRKKLLFSKTVQTCNKCQPVLPQSYNIHLKLKP